MRIGVLYNTSKKVKIGKNIDKISDDESFFTAIQIKKALSKKGHKASIVKVKREIFKNLKKNFDLIFNLVEDIQGNPLTEAKVAAYLEKTEIPFTGSKEKTLERCSNKLKIKKILIKNKIKTAPFQIFKDPNEKLGLSFPLIVKPLYTHGGLGIDLNSFVTSKRKLIKKVREVIHIYRQPAIVEEYIDGREINASVIHNGKKITVLPLSEILFNYLDGVPQILTYEAKWIEKNILYKNSILKCPVEIDEYIRKKIEAIAKNVFLLVGCNDYARIDFRLRSNTPYVIEVNPNPCLSRDNNEFTIAARAAGYNYDEMINKIVEIALERYSINKN